MRAAIDLKDVLGAGADRGALVDTVGIIARVAAGLSEKIALGPLLGFGGETGRNADGDTQKALDVIADQAFREALGQAVRWYASEEQESIVPRNPAATLAVAIDPLDGSSNIDANLSVGTIFSIYEAAATAEASILRPGREQLAAGYVIYGPQTAMVLAAEGGAALFLLDRGRAAFVATGLVPAIAPSASEFAINASNYRHWPKPVRAYIDDCLSGATGPRGKDFNMRWIASLVAEAHRILMRGGIFLYPADARPGYARGRLRLVYECAPIAFIVERAGGRATDGVNPILDKVPASLHERTPFVFGSAEKVARVAAYHDLPEREVAPLFGTRGLFTASSSA